MNNKQDMSNVIEVGDIVEFKTSGNLYLVRSIIDDNTFMASYKQLNNEFSTGVTKCVVADNRIVTKGDKREIIGYELLKDLPGIPAGTIANKVTAQNNYKGHWQFKGSRSEYYNQLEVLDTTWFKPIYKPVDIIVKISDNREVIITKNKADIPNVDSMSLLEVEYLFKLVNPTNRLGKHTCQFLDANIKVGCQEFTKQDIELVYRELIKLK